MKAKVDIDRTRVDPVRSDIASPLQQGSLVNTVRYRKSLMLNRPENRVFRPIFHGASLSHTATMGRADDALNGTDEALIKFGRFFAGG